MTVLKSLRFNPKLRGYVCQSCTRQLRREKRRYASEASGPELFDIVCVGGGPAGLSLLTALRASPKTSSLKVALVESQDLNVTRSWKLPDGQFSNRCSSLTPSSAGFLERIGAWNHVQRERVQPYEAMQVWDGITGARIEFDWPDTAKGKTIAYMIENANLTSALLARLDELSGVSVYDKTRVENILLGEETELMDLRSWPVVELGGGKRLAARLLIGADGANSPVRKFAGIESNGWDYNRHGIVATLRLSSPIPYTTTTAYQRFLPTGPIALLPLPGPYATLVWSTTPERVALLKSLSHADFTAMVNAAFRLEVVDLNYMHTIPSGQETEYNWRIQHTTSSSPGLLPQLIATVQETSIASFPLKMRHADTYIGDRIALIGDAAHTIHPLAGQGLNQGQGDAQSLVKTIEYAVDHGMDIGAQMSLEAYNSDRYLANHVLLGVVDKLHKLYAIEKGPVVPLRSLGLRAVNALGPLKEFFMAQAAGTGMKIL